MKYKLLAKRHWETEDTPMGEVNDLIKKYDDIINLSLGDHDFITDKNIIDAAFKDAQNGHTKYTDSQGDPELRHEIVKFYKDSYDYNLDINDIMIVVGACHGMYLTLESILDENDEVIVPEPYFTPYKNQIRLAGGKLVPLQTIEADEFSIDVDSLKKLITKKTKAILINTPNNPTGACLNRKNLEAIAQVAKDYDLLVISDDVYGAFSFGESFYPIIAIEGMKERTIIVSSFSKDYAMTGWRIGYVIGPRIIIDCIRNINEGVCFSAPSISQRAALHALRMKNIFQEEMIGEYKKRVFYVYNRIKKISKMSAIYPQGSFYIFINIKGTGLSSNEVSKRILEEAHVLTIPGNAFGESGEGYIRIACTVPINKLKESFDRIENMSMFSN